MKLEVTLPAPGVSRPLIVRKDLESKVEIDLHSRNVRGFFTWLDAEGEGVKSEVFNVQLSEEGAEAFLASLFEAAVVAGVLSASDTSEINVSDE